MCTSQTNCKQKTKGWLDRVGRVSSEEDRSATHTAPWLGGYLGRVGTWVGLEEAMLDMGGRMLHPKPSTQLCSALMHKCTLYTYMHTKAKKLT